MSQPVLLKVYGNICPVPATLLDGLSPVLQECLPVPDLPVASLSGDLLTLSFEGVYFPIDDVLAVLSESIAAGAAGKLDLLDLENWRLTRYTFARGVIETRSASLNNVLDYSGH